MVLPGERTSSSVLGRATSGDIEPGSHLLLLPVGSTEQHGPHLPLATDLIVAEALCARLQARRDDLIVGPAVTIGASGEHAGFAGTLSIGTEVLAAVITEVVRSARATFSGVVAVNGHGGNAQALAVAEATARAEGDDLLVLHPQFPGADAHAGRTETSLLLTLEPSLVRKDEAMAGITAPLAEIANELRTHGVAAVSPSGVLGDPRGASAEEGEKLLDAAIDTMADAIDERFPR